MQLWTCAVPSARIPSPPLLITVQFTARRRPVAPEDAPWLVTWWMITWSRKTSAFPPSTPNGPPVMVRLLIVEVGFAGKDPWTTIDPVMNVWTGEDPPSETPG